MSGLTSLKDKLEIKSNWDYLIIFIFFALAIFGAYKLEAVLLPAIGVKSPFPLLLNLAYWAIATIILYYISLYTLKVKSKWDIKTYFDLAIIFLVFALTGMSAVQIRKLIFPLIGITTETAVYIKILCWIFILTPFYYVFLLAYGFIFGKFQFFYGMFRKTFGRFGKLVK